MNTILTPPRVIEPIDPAESKILVRINPAMLSETTLRGIRKMAEPCGTSGDAFRQWLRDCVLMESGRRLANDDEISTVPLEVCAWLAPWHQWTDDELGGALAASYSWVVMPLGDGDADCVEAAAVFVAIYEAIVTAACSRLHEFHVAIEQSRRQRGEG